MHENRNPQSGKHEIGFAGQGLLVEPETVAQSVREAADDEFGCGVLPPHARHQTGSAFGRQPIDHGLRLRSTASIALPVWRV